MSTKATIAHSDSWHLYEELMDSPPDNIVLQFSRKDYDGKTITDRCRIPWEAAVALKTYVEDRLEQEANLHDPKWLMDKISEYQEELCDAGSGFYAELMKGWIEDLQNRLIGLNAEDRDQK